MRAHEGLSVASHEPVCVPLVVPLCYRVTQLVPVCQCASVPVCQCASVPVCVPLVVFNYRHLTPPTLLLLLLSTIQSPDASLPIYICFLSQLLQEWL